jgi:hypothetical protein
LFPRDAFLNESSIESERGCFEGSHLFEELVAHVVRRGALGALEGASALRSEICDAVEANVFCGVAS